MARGAPAKDSEPPVVSICSAIGVYKWLVEYEELSSMTMVIGPDHIVQSATNMRIRLHVLLIIRLNDLHMMM